MLWTDPDVLLSADIPACSLSVPRLLSIGPEATPGTPADYGVAYFNVSAYAGLFGGLVAWAAARRFEFDQNLLLQARMDLVYAAWSKSLTLFQELRTRYPTLCFKKP